MSEEPDSHDEPTMPADAVEDLAPEGDEQEVAGGAADYFLNLNGIKGEAEH